MPPPQTPIAQPVRKYLLRNRPLWDVEREFDLEELEEEEPEAFEAFEKKHVEDCEKYNDKPISDYPDWPWAVSELGEWYEEKYYLEAQMRHQDKFGLHIYNDFTGYGMQEVIENLVRRSIPFSTKFYKLMIQGYNLFSTSLASPRTEMLIYSGRISKLST